MSNSSGTIAGEYTAQMRWSWPAYLQDVVSVYRVRIEGWPLTEVPTLNLSDITHLRRLELLLREWKEGSTYFRAIDEAEYRDMMRDPSPWIGKASAEDVLFELEE
ncbi:hypothetical protein OH77DRAFT_1424249 [Trametes cingulata]|nr:hypothetical protein OH77DRAFT_1424249 [Trametes cingulata]